MYLVFGWRASGNYFAAYREKRQRQKAREGARPMAPFAVN